MSKATDITGEIFGRLRIISRSENDKWGNTRWLAECECGASLVVRKANLMTGHTGSCGCLNKEISVKQATTHGQTGTLTYRIWKGVTKRCKKENVDRYPDYAGRGISVCERWTSFENFLSDMGECPPGMSIERNDVDGNYEPSNCRWADDIRQANNRRGMTVYFVDGEWRGIRELSRIWNITLGLSRKNAKNWPSKVIGQRATP